MIMKMRVICYFFLILFMNWASLLLIQVHANMETEMRVGVGSRPPNCVNKCGGCEPCMAIQVPTTTVDNKMRGPQYANYEPEGWKCKCGSAFYNP